MLCIRAAAVLLSQHRRPNQIGFLERVAIKESSRSSRGKVNVPSQRRDESHKVFATKLVSELESRLVCNPFGQSLRFPPPHFPSNAFHNFSSRFNAPSTPYLNPKLIVGLEIMHAHISLIKIRIREARLINRSRLNSFPLIQRRGQTLAKNSIFANDK